MEYKMNDKIGLQFSFKRYNPNETYSNSFTISDEETYHVILEKLEVLLKALGYELNGRLDVVERLVPEGDENTESNVVLLHPPGDEE